MTSKVNVELGMNKTLSIVTITKNDIDGFLKTLESIVPFMNDSRIEWHVVDGGSSDGTEEFLRKFHPNNSHVHLTDLGLYQSMNYGLDVSSGKYIIFMNSGDRFIGDGILKLLSLVQNLDFDWYIANAYAVDQNYDRIWKWNIPNHREIRFKWGMRSFCHQSTIIKRSKMLEHGGFYTKSLFSDWQMSLKLSKDSPPAHLDLDLTEYLVGGRSSKTTLIYSVSHVVKLRSQLYRIYVIGLFWETLIAFPLYLARRAKRK